MTSRAFGLHALLFKKSASKVLLKFQLPLLYFSNHNIVLPQGKYSHQVIKPHISRAAPVNSVKSESGGAGGGHTEAGSEAEVQLAESVLCEDTEKKIPRSGIVTGSRNYH